MAWCGCLASTRRHAIDARYVVETRSRIDFGTGSVPVEQVHEPLRHGHDAVAPAARGERVGLLGRHDVRGWRGHFRGRGGLCLCSRSVAACHVDGVEMHAIVAIASMAYVAPDAAEAEPAPRTPSPRPHDAAARRQEREAIAIDFGAGRHHGVAHATRHADGRAAHHLGDAPPPARHDVIPGEGPRRSARDGRRVEPRRGQSRVSPEEARER